MNSFHTNSSFVVSAGSNATDIKNIVDAAKQSALVKRRRILKGLDKLDASTLPANILVLLSQYAKAIEQHNGIVVQLSSLNVFKHVEQTATLCNDPRIRLIYRRLLVQTSDHVRAGSMYLIGAKKQSLSSDSKKDNGDVLTVDLMVNN